MLLTLGYLPLLQPELNRAEAVHPQADTFIIVVVDIRVDDGLFYFSHSALILA